MEQSNSIFDQLESPLPSNWTPLEAHVILKCLDEDGDIAWSVRSTKGISRMEEIGILTSLLDSARHGQLHNWGGFVMDDSDDDEEPG